MKRFTFIALVIMILGFSVYAQETTGIKVNTALGGILYFNGNEVASLFDNDSYTIPIERPGTYSVKMSFANGKVATKSVVISSRGIVEVGFLMPPINIRVGTVGINSLPIMWDTAGSGVSYNVYYNVENHVDSAEVRRDIRTTAVTLYGLQLNRTYYVWVSVTEGGIEGIKSKMISQALITTRLGQIGPGGGIIFYDKGSVSDGWQYLEAAPAEAEFTAPFSPRYRSIPESIAQTLGKGIGSGKNNTTILVDFFNKNGFSGTAAQRCINLVRNGCNDWFLPSAEELLRMYLFLCQQGLGGFSSDWYFSSSSGSTYDGFISSGAIINFTPGATREISMPGIHNGTLRVSTGQITWHTLDFNPSYRVRAVRAF